MKRTFEQLELPRTSTRDGRPEAPDGETHQASARPALADCPELMTVTEAAEYLGIAVSTCYLLTKRAIDTKGSVGIPAVKVGGRTMVLRDRLGEWLHRGPQP
ncbi:MAG TPA: DNA-binding protein [Acidobacteria bacterium]|nr:DNA-binding protein [Acidobacteriota bacterium]